MKSAIATIWIVVLAACASAWEGYGPSLYMVLKDPSVETAQAHLVLLERIISDARKSGRRPPAGIQAEHAYYAWRLGKKEAARASLAAEAEDYPEAAKFLRVLERYLEVVTPLVDDRAAGEGKAAQ